MLSTLLRLARNPRLWQLALACYWVALFISTHVPIERIPIVQGSSDKLAHIVAFAGLSGLFAITWRLTTGKLTFTNAIWIWLVVVVYGLLEELTQPFVNRVASVLDLLADGSGAALGLALYGLLPKKWFEGPEAQKKQDAAAKDRHRKWYRFSLRTVFVVMTIVALLCYWSVLPTINAQKFVQAIKSKEYSAAEGLFVSGSDRFPGKYKSNTDYVAHAHLNAVTWNDILHGRRRISGTIIYGAGEVTTSSGAAIVAERGGLRVLWWVP